MGKTQYAITNEDDKAIQAIVDKEGISYNKAKLVYLEAKGIKYPAKADKPVRKLLTIAETKYGVCVVFSLEDCKALGFNEKMMTRPVIEQIRTKLGLKPKKEA